MSIKPSLFTATSLALRRDSRNRSETLFFAIIGRDGAQIFIKSEKDVAPVPNSKRHRHLRLDAFVYAPDPDALAREFAGRFADGGAAFSVPLKDTHDGLRGFEICDPDG